MLNSEQRWKDVRTIFEDVLPEVTKTVHKTPTIQQVLRAKKQAQANLQPKTKTNVKQQKKSTKSSSKVRKA